MRVMVLLGGNSPERDVSLVSGRAVAAALMRRGHQVVAVDTAGGRLVDVETPRGIGEDPPSTSLVPEGDAVGALEKLGRQSFGEVDVVFVALHGTGGEDGTIQAMLEAMGVAYTGSGVLASSVSMDKEVAKRVFRDIGVPTPPGFGATAQTPLQELVRRVGEECGWPVVVKPNGQGSSVGVSIVHGPEALAEAVEKAGKYDARLLFETFIDGRELTVAVLEGKALSVVEIVPRGGLYDYRSKYTSGSSHYHVPADIPDATARCMQSYAERCFEALRCRDFARIDFRLSPSLESYCLEVNTIPGMTPISLVPKAAQADGIDFDTLVEKITRAAAARGRVRSGG